jgi:di/tricarboxylate transporter
MNSGLMLAVILISVLVSIAIGFKFKISTGVVAMVFAYIIGCFFMELKVSEVVAMWPTKIAFMLMSITLFYGYAVENGTLKMMADKMLYVVKDVAWAVPIAIFVICTLLAGIGAGAPAVTAFMAPIGIAIAIQTGMNPLLVLLAISTGSLAGSNFTLSQGGVIVRGLLETTEYVDQSMAMTTSVFAHSFIENLIVFLAAYFVFGGYKIKKIDMNKPEPATPVQKKNLYLILGVMLIILVPVVINLFAPNPITIKMAKYCDIQMLAIVGALLCAALKLGDEKKIIKNHIPWNTIVMVGGISMLMGVATVAGAVEFLSNWVSTSIPTFLVPGILVFIAGGMSFFSGAVTVVVPMLVPMVPSLSATTGLNPVLLISCILIGSCCTGLSPFSTGGSLLLSGVKDEQLRDKIFYKQFVATLVIWALVFILAMVGVFNIFK